MAMMPITQITQTAEEFLEDLAEEVAIPPSGPNLLN